jgi:hypothetical protein
MLTNEDRKRLDIYDKVTAALGSIRVLHCDLVEYHAMENLYNALVEGEQTLRDLWPNLCVYFVGPEEVSDTFPAV